MNLLNFNFDYKVCPAKLIKIREQCGDCFIFLYFCIMISNNQAKLIRSLSSKKNREKTGLFVAEGPKVVGDLLSAGFEHTCLLEDDADIRKVSFLQHPQGMLGVFRIPQRKDESIIVDGQELVIALDGIQDPGNLGTIIRIADWFGIRRIFCSADTADCWNPKVVQATMGSIARVEIVYLDLKALITDNADHTNIYATVLDGNNIYEEKLSKGGIIVMGNEGNGISMEIRNLISHKLLIPCYQTGNTHPDSLNVAIATAIVCSEFRKNN